MQCTNRLNETHILPNKGTFFTFFFTNTIHSLQQTVLKTKLLARKWLWAVNPVNSASEAGLSSYFSIAAVPRISPLDLSSSSLFLVSSSSALMSSMVIPCHLSIQQKTCLWKFVKILFSVAWMKFSTLSCSPHHLNWMVTSL